MSSPNDEYSKQEETIEQEISHLELNITTNYFNIQNIQDELDEVLESLEQNDDRKIDVTKIPDEFVNNIIDYMYDDTPVNQRILIPHHMILVPHNGDINKISNPLTDLVDVNTWASNIFENQTLKGLFDYMKDFFDVTDDELESKQHRTRFALEVGRAIFQIHIRSLEKDMEPLQKKLLKLHPFTTEFVIDRDNLVQTFLEKSDEIMKQNDNEKQIYVNEIKILEDATGGLDFEKSPEAKIKSEKPIIKQFEIIMELETKLRELLKKVFSGQTDWWKKFVPLEITEKCQKRNRNNPDFERIQREQDSDLIGLLMFREIQIIITGSDNDNFNRLFRNIFDGYHYINSRLIEASILRNQICHMNDLTPKKQMQLENIRTELVYDIDEYLKSG